MLAIFFKSLMPNINPYFYLVKKRVNIEKYNIIHFFRKFFYLVYKFK